MSSILAKAALISTTGTVGVGAGAIKLASKYEVLDIANDYALAKYSNGYLGFWNEVGDKYSLRVGRTQEMRVSLASDPKSLTFTKDRSDLWKRLVLFCRRVNEKLMSGNALSRREVRNIGWCNNERDGYIPVSKKMGSRDYWIDLLIRAKYKSSDFEFWGKLSTEIGERTAKWHDLIKSHGSYHENLLKDAKVKCDAFRGKFDSKTKFVEKDLELIPLCRSSIDKR